MHVLLLESTVGSGAAIEAALTARGHVVHKCFERDDGPPGRCAELAGDGCPLHALAPDGSVRRVDVCVDVRTSPRTRPTLTESGLACAFGASVPIVVAADDGAQLCSPAVATAVPLDADAVLAAIDAFISRGDDA